MFKLPAAKKYSASLVAFVTAFCLVFALFAAHTGAEEDQINRLIGEKVMAIAATGALLLDGEMGDLHEQIVADGHRDSQAYKDFMAILQQIRDVNQATYVYTLIKVSDEMTNLIVDAAEGEEADPFGTEYEMEPQFETAFAGTPDYAVHTWDDEEYGTQKSAFAPIHNSQGEVVAILGVDYPAPELSAAGVEEEQEEVAGPAPGTFILILVVIAVVIGVAILIFKRKQAAA